MPKREVQNLRFHCLEHSIGFTSKSGQEVFCETGNHIIVEEFPGDTEWVYCFGCQRFYLSKPDERDSFPRKECISCGCKIGTKVVCKDCSTYYILPVDSGEEDIIQECLACGKAIGGLALLPHECPTLKTEFFTSAMNCHFCSKSIFGEEFTKLRELADELKNNFWLVSAQLGKIDRELGKLKNEPDRERIISMVTDIQKNLNDKVDEMFKSFAELFSTELKQHEKAINRHIKIQNVHNNKLAGMLTEIRNRLNKMEEGSNLSSDYKSDAKVEVNTDFLLPTGFVSDLINRYRKFTGLKNYAGYDNALKHLDTGDLLPEFYLLQIGKLQYAIPAIESFTDKELFSVFSRIFTFQTGGMEGRVKVVEPAQLVWNVKIQGFGLMKKGILKIV